MLCGTSVWVGSHTSRKRRSQSSRLRPATVPTRHQPRRSNAALLPPVWLVVKRMWFELVLYIAGTGLLVWALTSAGATDLSNALLLTIQIVFGFEAGALYGAALERRGWRLVGTVTGRGQEDSERRFLEVWLPTRTEIPPAPLGTTTPAAPSWTAAALTRAKETIARGRRAWAGAQT